MHPSAEARNDFLKVTCSPVPTKKVEEYIASLTTRRELFGIAFQSLNFVHASWWKEAELAGEEGRQGRRGHGKTLSVSDGIGFILEVQVNKKY